MASNHDEIDWSKCPNGTLVKRELRLFYTLLAILLGILLKVTFDTRADVKHNCAKQEIASTDAAKEIMNLKTKLVAVQTSSDIHHQDVVGDIADIKISIDGLSKEVRGNNQ